MLYLISISTRESVTISEEGPARALHQSFGKIKKLREKGIIKFAGLTGPFTPMATFLIAEANNHEEAFEIIRSMPGVPYTNSAIYPIIDIDNVGKYLATLVKRAPKKSSPK